MQAIAAAGLLTASRLAAVFLTLEKQPPLVDDRTAALERTVRVSFPPSKIVWQHYPGQGIEIQWLGTFGAGNGFYLSGHENANLRQLVDEVIPLATKRAGGHRLGVPVPLRRRLAAVDERALAGHRRCRCSRAPGQRFKEPAYLTAATAGARHLPAARRRTACA